MEFSLIPEINIPPIMDSSFQLLLASQQLIICVDDFGLTPMINRAVIDLATDKKINGTSVLVDAPYLTEDYIEEAILLKHKNQLQIGLHLNFTEILSPAQNPELVKPINKQLIASKFYTGKTVQAIYEEIERQFFLFKELFDEYPNFIDGHQHVHMLPGFNQALRRFYVEHRLDHEDIWIRSLNRVNKLNKGNLPGISNFKNLVLRLFTKKAQHSVYKYRRELLGVYNFEVGGKDYEHLLEFWLKNAAEYIKSTGRGAVIMCHPAIPKSELDADEAELLNHHPEYRDPISRARIYEYEVLKDFNYN